MLKEDCWQILKIYFLKIVVLEKITSIFDLYHVKDCSVLHLKQQLCHASKNRHFSKSTNV